MKIADKLLDLVFPPRCAFCGTLCQSGVCSSCERTLPFAEKPLQTRSFARVASPLRYEGSVREAVLRLKFSGGLGAVHGFAQLMASCAAEELSGEFDTVTFVPVSTRRRFARGYDQSQRLARELAKLWGTDAPTLLKKTHHTAPQSTMRDAAQRRANVFGVYEAVSDEALRGAHILLVDDVVTTGATLGECVRVLKEGGAASVVCLTLAAAQGKDGKAQK